MIITKEKIDQLQIRMKALGIADDDLIIKFILGAGSGGQKINKTSSCVYVKHIPSGIQIKCQRARSREYNRYIALSELCDRLEKKQEAIVKEKIHLKEKLRRQNKKRSFAGKEKMLEQKKQRSSIKKLRNPSKKHED